MKSICMIFLLLASFSMYGQKWEKNYDFVDDCICGLSKVGKNGLVGYADKKGKEVIPVEFNEGLTFSEGMVAVKKAGKWMYFDSTGKAITQNIFDDATSFEGGMAAVSKSNLYGYINYSGEVLINYQFSNARTFKDGLAPAANAKGYWGFIDKQGNWVIKPQYAFADHFTENEARVMKGEKVFYINKENSVLHE